MYLSWLYGQARTTFCHSENVVKLPLKADSNGSGSKKEISVLDLAKETAPPCRLNPLLFNGYLQTAWTATKSADTPIHYKRHVFTSAHETYPGIFAVDFVIPPPANPPAKDPELPVRTHNFTDEEFAQLGSDDDKPMLICLHGLSGGSYELYLRHVLKPLVENSEWEACVVNARGCANSKVVTSRLFNARATWDARQTIEWIHQKWPRRRLFGIGFSLGANILVNYLGEEGSNCILDAAVVVCNPWNLEACGLALQRSWIGLNVFSASMGASMRRLFEKHVDQISKNPDIDVAKVRSSKYLHEFDRYVQCASWGYPTEYAYYRDASSSDAVLGVKTPLFAIHAEDDPIAVDEGVPRQEIMQNPNVVLCSTSLGGHLSHFEIGGGRWFAKAATAFLKKIATDVDWKSMSEAKLTAADGHLPEESKIPKFDPVRRRLHGSGLPGR